MSTIKKVYKNVGASILPQLVNIISNFVLPVMIIELYGSSINGLVSTVKSIVSYIALVGAGISVATTQALYAPVAKGEDETVKGMLKATGELFNKCGWIYIAIVLVVSLTYPLCIKGDTPFSLTCLLILVVSISGASEFFVVGRCRSLLYANQKVYVCTTIQAFSLLASLMLAIIMLRLKASIVLVQFGISFVYIVRALLLSYYVKKHYPQYRYNKNTPPIYSAIEKRNDAMIHQLSGLLVFGSQSIILSSMVSLEAASIYAIYSVVFSGIFSICSNMNVAVTPFIGKSIAVNRQEKIQSEFDCVEFLFFSLTTFIFMVSIVTILPFIGVYTKDADINYIYPVFALLFVLVYIFNVFRLPHSAMINAAGRFKETRWRAIAEASICVIASITFTYFLGLYGVLAGTCLAIGWRCFDMIIYSHRDILQNGFMVSSFRLLRVFIYTGAVYIVFRRPFIVVDNYIHWIEYASIIAIVAICTLLCDALLFERKTVKRLLSYFIH